MSPFIAFSSKLTSLSGLKLPNLATLRTVRITVSALVENLWYEKHGKASLWFLCSQILIIQGNRNGLNHKIEIFLISCSSLNEKIHYEMRSEKLFYLPITFLKKVLGDPWNDNSRT